MEVEADETKISAPTAPAAVAVGGEEKEEEERSPNNMPAG